MQQRYAAGALMIFMALCRRIIILQQQGFICLFRVSYPGDVVRVISGLIYIQSYTCKLHV